MPAVAETTPTGRTAPTGSLEEASTVIAGLLSETPSKKAPEDPTPATDTPEPDQAEPDPKLAPTAPEATPSESEPAESESTDGDPEAAAQPKTFTVKINGENVEVTEAELLKGYSREKDYTVKSQRLAELRKEFEEKELAAVRTERQQYSQYLGELKNAITALMPAEPDWEKLRAESTPDVFQEQWVNWHAHSKRLSTIAEEQAKVQAAQEADAKVGFAKHVQEENRRLGEALPEMADPEKAPVLRRELGTYAKSLGFTDQDLESVTDHRVVLLLHKAMRHDQAAKKAPAIQDKVASVLKASAPGSRSTPQKTDQLKADQARLKSSGSVDDAARVFRHLID